MTTPVSVVMMVTPKDVGLRGSFRELTDADSLATGGALASLVRVTDPAAPGTTNIVAATASNASNTLVVAASPDVPRNLRAVFAASYDGGNITVTGTDQWDTAQTEVIVAAAGSTVVGTKIFKTVTAAVKATVGATANTVSIGTGSKLGVMRAINNNVGQLTVDGTAEAVTIDPATDAFTPTTTPNGSHDYTLLCSV